MRDGCAHKKDDEIGHRYQLRYAAGLYWLLDMQQSGASYVNPVPMNEGGARLWNMFERGMPKADVCKWFGETYDLSLEQAQQDVQDFIEQLRSNGVALGGMQ